MHRELAELKLSLATGTGGPGFSAPILHFN